MLEIISNKWLLPLLTVTFVLIFALSIVYLATDRRPAIEVNVESTEQIDDDMAISISRTALEKARLLDPMLVPMPYNGKKIFARNIHNPNDGYVLWRWQDKRSPGYTVYITRKGASAICRISRHKT